MHERCPSTQQADPPNKENIMKTIMTTPRILRLPAIALLPVLAFSLAGQALAAAPPTPTDSTIQGDSIQRYNLRGISQSANSGVAPAKAASGDCWIWIDAKTGKQVPTVPISGANLVGDPANAGAAGVAQMDGFDPKADRAFNSKTGQNFVRVPCPPPTASATSDGVKTASADSSVPAPDKSTLWQLRPFDNFGAENAHTIGAGKFAVNEFFGYGWRRRIGDMVQRTDESWNIGHKIGRASCRERV